MWSTEDYPYRGVPLRPHMLAELAEKSFLPGSIMPRKWLIEDAPKIHIDLGGEPTSSDAVSQAKKARATLLTDGWEQAGFGSVRRLGELGTEVFVTEGVLAPIATIAQPIIEADEWIGEGEETVYCYTFPTYIELARLKGESRMPLKIGMTASPTLERVSLQCGTSNPEQPVIPFAIRVQDAALFEKTIQKILSVWDRWMEDAPGSEWFMTSREEVLKIVNFLNGNTQ